MDFLNVLHYNKGLNCESSMIELVFKYIFKKTKQMSWMGWARQLLTPGGTKSSRGKEM